RGAAGPSPRVYTAKGGCAARPSGAAAATAAVVEWGRIREPCREGGAMSESARVSAMPSMPADVLAFADEAGVKDYVRPVLEMTMRLFGGRPTAVGLQGDPNIP